MNATSGANAEVGCFEFRRTIGADPTRRDAALAQHRLACRGCAEYARGVEQLDRALLLALAVPVPEGLAHRVVLRATAERAPAARRWAVVAAAAAVVAAIGATWAVAWRTPAPTSLAAEVMAHAHHEPQSWAPALEPVSATRLRGVLDRGEVELLDQARLGMVSYANSCPLRGHRVPHLTVQSVAGPAMVLLLPDEPLAREQALDEDGLRGVLVPVGRGSIAIVAADPRAVEAVRRQVTAAVGLGI